VRKSVEKMSPCCAGCVASNMVGTLLKTRFVEAKRVWLEVLGI